MNTIEKIIKLCKETDGLSVHKLEMDLGFGNAYFRSTQKITADRLYLVAKYFNVPMESLLSDDVLPDETEKAATETSDGNDRNAEFIKLFSELSPEQQDRVIAQLRDLAQLQKVLGVLSKSE